MIAQLSPSYPVETLCAVLDCPRSSYYYHSTAGDDAPLRTAIEQIVIRWPYYGYRRVTAELRRAGWTVNSKVVRRLLHEVGQPRIGRVGWHTPDSRHALPRYPNLVQGTVAAYPDHIWGADITYVRWHTRFIYLAVILDAFSRAVRGWHSDAAWHRT